MRGIYRALNNAERRFNWHRHILRDDLRMRRCYARGSEPVIVYSAPKTASAAVYKALRTKPGVFALKSHTLRPEHWRPGRLDPAWMPGWTGMWRDCWHSDRLVHNKIINAKRPARFVALVRDPIATSVSAFLYFKPNWFRDLDAPPPLEDMDEETLTDTFLARYPHHVATDWFDLEPKHTLGIDPLDHPFPHARGVQELRSGAFRLLIVRTDLDDAAKGAAVAGFLGLGSLEIPRFNVGASYGHDEVAGRLRSGLSRRPEHVGRMLDHPFTRHFWTEAERDAMRSKWLGPPG